MSPVFRTIRRAPDIVAQTPVITGTKRLTVSTIRIARDRHLSGYAWSRYANRVGPRPTPDARPWEALSLLGAAWPAA
ncbi:hypothetical protein KBZ21_41815, partial [Streptomyces sp. A73]|nr:hypothetical protein [Streptomyces sp. A73]